MATWLRCPAPANVYTRQSSHSPQYLLELLYPSIGHSQELVLRGQDAGQIAATANSYSKALEGLRSVGTHVSFHNLSKTFATHLLSGSTAITDVQHLLGHASVKTTEKAYAAFVKNERFKQTIDLLDEPVQPRLKVVGLVKRALIQR